MDIEKVKIKNLDINKSAFKKKRILKLCVGVIIVGSIVIGSMNVNASTNQKNTSSKSFNAMSKEEIEETRIEVSINFQNIDKLTSNRDNIVFVRDKEYIMGIAKINKDGSGNNSVALLPGEYTIVSKYAGTTDIFIEDASSEYELTVDYDTMTLSIGDIDMKNLVKK